MSLRSLFPTLFETNNSKNIDFLAIGDTATDAFIRLKDAEVHCSINNDDCELCVKFADKIPYEFSKIIPGVGNSANAAVSAARLGISSALLSYVGDDQFGTEVFEKFKKENIDTRALRIEKGKETNYHYVLWYQAERTILIKHTVFSYKLGTLPFTPRWVYLSSLANNTEQYHDEIADYIEKNKDIKFAFQPGTFQIKLGADRLKRLYARSDVFVCNTDEAKIILNDTQSDIKGLLLKMRESGPKTVLITDGPKGAYAYDGTTMYFQPPYPDPKPPYERTGAGDAFASTFVCALVMGKSIEQALMWAPINSMSVVQYVGAQEGLLTPTKLEEYLKKAPGDYQPRKI